MLTVSLVAPLVKGLLSVTGAGSEAACGRQSRLIGRPEHFTCSTFYLTRAAKAALAFTLLHDSQRRLIEGTPSD